MAAGGEEEGAVVAARYECGEMKTRWGIERGGTGMRGDELGTAKSSLEREIKMVAVRLEMGKM